MKSLTLIAVLAALTVCNDAASFQNEVPPGQEDVVMFEESGQVYQKNYDLEGATVRQSKDDRILLHEENVSVQAIHNEVQVRDVVYRGNSTTRITRIVVTQAPSHLYVGNYWTHALVRLKSAPSHGLRTSVRFFGRYTDRP